MSQKKDHGRKTDWDAYYSGKKNIVSTLTQSITIKYLVSIINRLRRPTEGLKIMEIGGGNSCFAEAFCKQLSIKEYHILDNCEKAVDMASRIKCVTKAHMADAVQKIDPEEHGVYDLVFSVGLIEHFSDEDRRRVIENHFDLCKPGGYVLITAPTPTRKYRLVRGTMEFLNVWQFWDERAITYEKIKNDIGDLGKIIYLGTNKKLPLTQLVIVVRKPKKRL